jgi:hypothetical protein
MTHTNETRAGGRGLGDDAFPGGNCSPEKTPKADVAQVNTIPSAEISQAINPSISIFALCIDGVDCK